VSHPRRQQSSYSPPWESKVSDSVLSRLRVRVWISDWRHLVHMWHAWLAMRRNPVRIADQQFVV
jgi:hypothetical protein